MMPLLSWLLVVLAYLYKGTKPAIAAPPQPLNEYITSVSIDTTVKTAATGSDIWVTTWASNGQLYTAYGDGWSFDTLPQNFGI